MTTWIRLALRRAIAAIAVTTAALVLLGVDCGWSVGAEGTVKSSVDGSAIAGARVSVLAVADDAGTLLRDDLSGSDGSFQVTARIYSGHEPTASEYRLTVEKTGFDTYHESLGATPSEAAWDKHVVDVLLHPSVSP